MTYYDYLCRLLEPMRVYRTERGTLSGGELYAAGAVLIAVPVAILYLALQKYFVSGLTSGSTKG